jgi:starch phosphorylase
VSRSYDKDAVKRFILMHLRYSIGKAPESATVRDWYNALASAIRDRLAERWGETNRRCFGQDTRRVYYLSMEFMVDRSLRSHLVTLGLLDGCLQAVAELGLDFAAVEEMESEAGLGWAGLGSATAGWAGSPPVSWIP